MIALVIVRNNFVQHTLYEVIRMYQLPVNNHQDETYWVVTDSVGSYMIGEFDGKLV